MIAAAAILERTNAAIDREDRLEAVEDLKTMVEDWKGHRIEGFGELLLYGQYTVLKGDGMNGKNEEREVGFDLYPFQTLHMPIFALFVHLIRRLRMLIIYSTRFICSK
jgi:cell division control protein 24